MYIKFLYKIFVYMLLGMCYSKEMKPMYLIFCAVRVADDEAETLQDGANEPDWVGGGPDEDNSMDGGMQADPLNSSDEEDDPLVGNANDDDYDPLADDGDEEEDSNDDDLAADDNYIPPAPTQEQLRNISFESNQFGKYCAILIDGEQYRYRIHRRDKADRRRWYRCVSRWTVNCRATACFDVGENVITKLSCLHNHSPPVFKQFVR